jgi:glycosyltransferase involved in cell wall biosynthesis
MQIKKKKVAIIGTNGIPARYGGFETLAEYLTKKLNKDFNFIVYCSSIYKKKDRLSKYNNSTLKYLPLKANGIQSLLYDIVCTFHAWFTADVIVVLGPAAGFILPLNYFFNKKIIVNHGGLNEWEREKLNFIQRKYVYLTHKIAAKSANFNIADNLPLAKNLKKTFGVDTQIIEYGGDHIIKEGLTKELKAKFIFLNEAYDLSVSRAQIDNNLHLLLNAYKNFPNRNLVLVSNWSISEYGINLKKEYLNKYKNIFVVDAIYNKKDLDVIRSNTSLYIHSHSRCGTAPSLVEAMNYNIPIISFDVETNRITTEDKCLYFSNEFELINVLKSLNESVLSKIKKDTYKTAIDKYKWSVIADKYRKILNE